ncbi:MAG TPA: PspC domain-containing protein [Candidatus Binatia bacterium]|nr:PspC domain-containing protein [Candidatus Binatia bacterium]
MSDDKLKSLAKTAGRELKQYRRLPGPGWIGGVCAGLAYRTGIPTWIIRLAWTLLILCKGVGLVPYILLWIFVPRAAKPSDYTARTGDS